MPGQDDWIIEEDGLPPANSSIAWMYEEVGEPITCCEIISPPMGEEHTDYTGWFFVISALLLMILIVLGLNNRR